MALKFQLFDAVRNVFARITSLGEVVTNDYDYSEPYYVSVDSVGDAFEVVAGKPGKCFIVKSLLIASSKTFGSATTAETVTVYEANPSDLTTSLKIFVKLDLLKNDRMPITGLNLKVGKVNSLVVVATDTDVDVTIAGYYVPEVAQ